FFFFFQAEDGIRDKLVTGVQTCALPILMNSLRALSEFIPSATGASSLSQARRNSLGSSGSTPPKRSVFWSSVSPNFWTAVFRSRSEERRVGKEGRCRRRREQ